MNRMRAWFCAVGVCGLSFVVQAEDSAKKVNEAKSVEGTIVRVSAIVGMQVTNLENKNIGKVEDIVLDTQTGQVRYVAISFGGFLGFGEKLFAVPYKSLRVVHSPGSNASHLEANINKESLENAKGFDKTQWPNFGDPNFAKENDRHFIILEVRKQ